MLGQRRRQCANIETTLAGKDVETMLVQRLSTIYDVGPTLSQLWFNVLSLLACQYTCIGPILYAYRPLTAQQNKHSPDVALLLGELHRQCSNIKPAKRQFNCFKNLGLRPTVAYKRSENFKNTLQAMQSLILLCLINLIAICGAPEVTTGDI